MDAKLRTLLEDFDEFSEDLPKSQLSPEVLTELDRVRAQGQYLRSEAYHRHLTRWSSVFALVITLAIGLGVYYLLVAAGKNPAKLQRNLFEGFGSIAVYFLYRQWQTWRKAGDRAV